MPAPRRRALDNISAELPTLSLYCLRPIDTLCHLIGPPRQTLLGSAKKKELEAFLQADIVARYCGQLYYNGLLIYGIGSRQLIDNCWLVCESATRLIVWYTPFRFRGTCSRSSWPSPTTPTWRTSSRCRRSSTAAPTSSSESASPPSPPEREADNSKRRLHDDRSPCILCLV